MTVEHQGRSFEISPKCFTGTVDGGCLTFAGARITCWATAADRAFTLSRFLIRAGGRTLASAPPTRIKADNTLFSGADIDVAYKDIPPPFDCRFEVFAADDTRGVACILPKTETYSLDRVFISTTQDFARLIQTPASRIRDESTLLYAAIHVARRMPGEYAILAGAICVVGYRLLHNFKCEADIEGLLDDWIQRFSLLKSPLPPGTTMRWQISVHILAAYMALKRRDLTRAEKHLLAISEKGAQLELWPSQLTNILLSFYGLGYLAHGRGASQAATAFWEKGETIFRSGCALAKFPNYYSYGELGNALAVARECHLGRFVIDAGGVIRNVNIAATGTKLDPKRLPAPLGWLLPPLKDLSKEALIEAARRCGRALQWSDAAYRYELLRRWFPNDSFAYSRGGDSLRELGKLDEAEAVLSAAVGLFPQDIDVLRAHARLSEARGDWMEASLRWETAIGVQPENSAFWISSVRALSVANRTDEAMRRCGTMLERFPDDVKVVTAVASIRLKQGGLESTDPRPIDSTPKAAA